MSSAPRCIEICAPCTASPGESDAAVQFLRERLVLFARVLFTICFGFYVVANLLRVLDGHQAWDRFLTGRDNQLHILTCAVLAGMWALASRGRPTLPRLLWTDAVGSILVVLGCALIGLTEPGSRAEYQALLGATHVLVARAVLVPSRASRTLWIGLAACAPIVAVGIAVYDRPKVAAGLETGAAFSTSILALWCVTAIAVSAVASRVIYGLRREAREARRLGQYTLEEKIGSGGMGEVYRASHALLRRPTAIKLLPCDRAGELNIARFEREVQLTSRLTHPNTVAIYDYGRTPDGVFYYAMEYLPGITLEDLVRQDGAQPPGRVIHVLKQVCASLREAHAVGLIHRDIKGANVILCERGGMPDVAKVVDFGLVKDTVSQDSATLSAANTITGTPHYLSPEAIRSPGAVDARSDLYSVGVLGYYLLTGKRLFESDSVVEVMSHHLHTTPTPLSARTPRPVPRDIEEAIMSCLEKDPARRPQTAQALMDALEASETAGIWGEAEARAWWRGFEKRARDLASAEEATATVAAPAPAAAGAGP